MDSAFREFTIRLNNTNAGVFHADQRINGVVQLSTTCDIAVQTIRVEIRSEASTNWTEHCGVEKEILEAKEVLQLQGFEVIWNAEKKLSEDELDLLPAGYYEFPFELQIPKICSSSFKDEYGALEHKLRVVITGAEEMIRSIEIPITIINQQNCFSLLEETDLPVVSSNRKRLGFLPLFKGHIDLTLRIAKQGLAIGDSVPYELYINNQSRNRIKLVRLLLKQKIIYRGQLASKWREKHETNVIIDKKYKLLLRSGKSVLLTPASIGLHLIIPDVPAQLPNCTLIQLHYFVEALCQTSKSDSDICVTVPIALGSLSDVY